LPVRDPSAAELDGGQLAGADHVLRADLELLDRDTLEARAHRRGSVTRAQVAEALAGYYELVGPHRFCKAAVDGWRFATSVITQPAWLDIAVTLGHDRDDIIFDPAAPLPAAELAGATLDGAVRRLAETLAIGTRLVNAPIYRLLGTAITPGRLSGTVGLARFMDYALTLDLLENELIDAISQARPTVPGSLPLRDAYLPDTAAITSPGGRLCAGGPLALLAIARPVSRRRGGRADYALIIQERSGRVLNSARRLAVIPKGFHEPLVDFSADAQISATLEREMEEELFGRAEVDCTAGEQLAADPMHASRLSPPMRWLVSHPDPATWSAECVGFGLNAMTGNFEFASLIVIHDPAWWDEHGGAIQANWETEGIRRYSSLDRDQLAELAADPAWSNEGLFAFCQAIRRLAQLGGDKMNLPDITWEA